MTGKSAGDGAPDQDPDIAALAAGLAHDFNNLLLALTSCLELIRARSSEERVVDIAGHGLKTIDRGGKLVDRVLALGGLSSPPPRQPAAAAAAAAAAATSKRQRTVLVVDDDAEVRLVLVELLRSLGYKLIEAANGADGIAALDRVPTLDLAIIDFALPGQHGKEVAIELLDRRPDLPIVFATGYTESGTRDPRLRDIPMLYKPFRIAELAKTVAAALGP
ncbi:MAG TPA: response regulator [Aliidongia sp.]|nr:response regulator [Aliidongia sp.]